MVLTDIVSMLNINAVKTLHHIIVFSRMELIGIFIDGNIKGERYNDNVTVIIVVVIVVSTLT